MRRLTWLTLSLLLAACGDDAESDKVGTDTGVQDGSGDGSGSGAEDTSGDTSDDGSGDGSGSGEPVPDLLDRPTVFGLDCAPEGRSAAAVIRRAIEAVRSTLAWAAAASASCLAVATMRADCSATSRCLAS